MLVPVKLKPDKKVRGWKPRAGWYIFDTCTMSASKYLDQRYSTEGACWWGISVKTGIPLAEVRSGQRACTARRK